ncbi:MAG: nucleoside triphosphate pyrophosphohydrolase [Patescibacteria group bacterium]
MTIYNKLVRDKIPEIIAAKGGSAKTHVASAEEYEAKLLEKLQEEVKEFIADKSPEELADIEEVLSAIYAHFGFSREEIEAIRQKKAQERGGFTKRIILEES